MSIEKVVIRTVAYLILSSVVITSACSTASSIRTTALVDRPTDAETLSKLEATSTPTVTGIPSVDRNTVIAIDLVNALVQFKGMHPTIAKLGLAKSDADFSPSLRSVLLSAGYTLNSLAMQHTYKVLSSVTSGDTEPTGEHRTYQLTVGDIAIKRKYLLDNQGGVLPSSNLFVQGADASEITLHDYIFTDAAPQVTVPATANMHFAANVFQTGPIANRIELLALAGAADKNIVELGDSNFNQLFNDFVDVGSMTVVFASDSMRLGESEKSAITRFLATFKEKTDVISVVGCSHGKTSIDDGNRLLAIGRADRVAEELRLAGIDESNILQEGCWATDNLDDGFPARGVLLTVKREKPNG